MGNTPDPSRNSDTTSGQKRLRKADAKPVKPASQRALKDLPASRDTETAVVGGSIVNRVGGQDAKWSS